MNMTTSSFSWAFISLFQDGIELTESLKGKRQLSTTVSKEDYASILQLCMPVSVQGCVCKILSVCVCLIVKRPSAILIVYVFILGYITRFFRKTEMNMLHNFRFTFLYPIVKCGGTNNRNHFMSNPSRWYYEILLRRISKRFKDHVTWF